MSLASLARSLFGAIPMEQVMPNWCLILALIRQAIRSAEPKRRSEPVTSRNA
jgi:hypothetical protein